MNKVTITDFLIKLGFDGEEVKKGVKGLKKEFAPLQATLTKESNRQAKAQKTKNAGAQKENQLASKRLAIQKNISKLKAKGSTEGVRSLQDSLRGKDPVKLEAARIRSAEMLHLAEKKITQKENQLASKRLAIQKNISKLKAKGSTEGVRSLQDSLRGKDPVKLEAARIRSAEMLHLAEKKITQEKAKAAAITARERVARTTARTTARSARGQEGLEVKRMGFNDQLTGINSKMDRANLTGRNAQAANELKREISKLSAKGGVAKTRKEFALLRREYVSLKNRSDDLLRANREVRKDIKASSFAVKSLSDSVRNLSRSYLSMFAVIGGTVSFVRTGQELTSLKATLLGVSGTSQGAAKDFEFVSAASKSLGIDLTEATSSYGKLGAAAKSAGLSSDDARNAFLAATEVSTAFNLSSSDFEGVSRAMSQILAKGKLSTEELLQLGERVPIAFSSAAKSLGVSTKELFKQIETGRIQSVDFLPNFADEMRTYVRETGMLTASLNTSRVAMNRFTTTYKLGVDRAFSSGLDKGVSEDFNSLSNIMTELGPVFEFFGTIAGFALKIAGPILTALWQMARGLISLVVTPFNLLSQSLEKSVEDMNFFELALLGVYDGLKQLAAVVLYPFAKLEEGLDWLDNWMDGTDAKLSGMSIKTGNIGGSPVGVANAMSSSAAGGNTNNSTSQTNTIMIDGAQDPVAVGEAVSRALDLEFSSAFATGY